MWPSSDDGSSFPRDQDILNVCNEEVSGYLAPFINLARQGQFISHVDQAVTANINAYPVPPRALGADISTVQLIDGSGNPLYPPLVQTDLETATKWPWNNSTFGQPLRFYFEGDNIVLVPCPLASGQTLRIYYPERPSQLVFSTQVVTITSITQGAPSVGYYELGFTATAPSSFTVTNLYETVSQNPSWTRTALGLPNTVTANYVSFAGTAPTSIVAGDTLTIQDTANVLTGISADLFGLVAQWVVVRLKEGGEDDEAYKRALAVYDREEKRLAALLGKRVQLARRKIAAAQNRPWGRMPPFYAR